MEFNEIKEFPDQQQEEEEEDGEQEDTLIDDELTTQEERDGLKQGDSMEDPFLIRGDEETNVLRAKLERHLYLKKYIVNKIFEDHFDPNDGEKSKDLFSFMEVTRDLETGKVNGVQYKGKQVIIKKGASLIFNPKVDISEFQRAAADAQEEFDDTPLGRFKNQLEDEEGLFNVNRRT